MIDINSSKTTFTLNTHTPRFITVVNTVALLLISAVCLPMQYPFLALIAFIIVLVYIKYEQNCQMTVNRDTQLLSIQYRYVLGLIPGRVHIIPLTDINSFLVEQRKRRHGDRFVFYVQLANGKKRKISSHLCYPNSQNVQAELKHYLSDIARIRIIPSKFW